MNSFENPTMQAQADRLNIAELVEQWQDRDYQMLSEYKHLVPVVEPTENTSRAYIIEPEVSKENVDETQSIVLALPHLNGFSDHHLIRAQFMQQALLPNGRVIVLPNNSFNEKDNYDIEAIKASSNPNHPEVMRALAEQQMRTLEHINKNVTPLGNVALTGYSLGASLVLNMASVGSSCLEVTSVNADEAPQQAEIDSRSGLKLSLDFMASGNGLAKSVKEAGIPALADAMSFYKRNKDIAKFGIKSMSKDGSIMSDAMREPLDEAVLTATNQGIPVKLGHIEGSKLFMNEWTDPTDVEDARIVKYSGKEFRDHTSGDNVVLHALMAADGLTSLRR